MILNLKQRKIKIKPRIKLNHNMYKNMFRLTWKNPGSLSRGFTVIDETLFLFNNIDSFTCKN